MSLDLALVVGTRPNLIKAAPLVKRLREVGRLSWRTIHTGQHYDPNLSDVFFADLEMPQPEINLGVGSGSHAEMTGAVLTLFERWLIENAPRMVVVFGDVNSTLAATLAASKLHIPVAHVEAGLRCFDRSLPEEVNRVVTDALSTLCLAPSSDGIENLLREGKRPEEIQLVGNIMIDTFMEYKDRAIARHTAGRFGLVPGEYAYLTLHRPATVDAPDVLRDVWSTLGEVARRLPILFPVHPRTASRIRDLGLPVPVGITMCDPLGYLDNLSVLLDARLVLTDSGGLQEESTAAGVTCLTLRPNTERPITITEGTNRLVGTQRSVVLDAVDEVLAGWEKVGRVPDLWDGRTAERIVDLLAALLTFSPAG